MIKIDFSFHSQYGTFSDALWLEDDHGLTEKQISAMQQQRFDNWVAIITAPPPNYVLDADGNVILDIDGNPVIAE